MNKLSNEKRTQVVACLVEGNSIRATVRMTGVAKKTVTRLLVDLGRACSAYQDRAMVNLPCKRIQCDEIWQFVQCKQKNVTPEKRSEGKGDSWTFVAIDAQTKLIPAWLVSPVRDASAAYHFMHDLKARLANRVQLTTDGHKAYLYAVEDAFGADVDFAQLVKIYGNAPEGGEVRYSPAVCMGRRKQSSPASRNISTAQRASWSAKISR